ncbi:hypothetical protein JI739_10670 [Ramlibacter sp. AW1]|uniref:Uncharacterized protein n=1 Tax=Ramlibacter aurantiacus TaxID=2801330 RepID=A0A936ZH38_9BURK|nr:hypothetical protein [Ramlibacter aurantiacus]MBL0420807.1 hypothetical protein [Ramlibacter aurantiacus]
MSLKNRLSDELGDWFDRHPVRTEQDRIDLAQLRNLDLEELTGKPDLEFHRMLGAGLRRLEAIERQARQAAQSVGQGDRSPAFSDEQHFRLYAQGTLLQLLDQPVASTAPARSCGARLARLRIEVNDRLAVKSAKADGRWLSPHEVLDAAYAALGAVRPGSVRLVPSPLKIRRDRFDALMTRVLGEWGSWLPHFLAADTVSTLWKQDTRQLASLPREVFEQTVEDLSREVDRADAKARELAAEICRLVAGGQFVDYEDQVEFRLFALGVMLAKVDGLPLAERRQALSRFRTSIRLCEGRRGTPPDPRTVLAYAAQAMQAHALPASPARSPGPGRSEARRATRASESRALAAPALETIAEELSDSRRRLSDSERTESEPGSAWLDRVARQLEFMTPSKSPQSHRGTPGEGPTD